MSHYEYYCLTPLELSELMQGWARRHSRYLEGVRIVAHTIAQVNSTTKLPPMSVWMPLITDEKKVKHSGQPTEEEKLAAQARIRQAKKTGKLTPVKIVE